MAYSVGDFKKMMKDAYKTAFGYRGATVFNNYRRYAGNKFRYCSECENMSNFVIQNVNHSIIWDKELREAEKLDEIKEDFE